MQNKKKRMQISVRSIIVKDMILTCKGGPHTAVHHDDWWDEQEELESWEDEEEG